MAAVAVAVTGNGENPLIIRMENTAVWWEPGKDGHAAYGVFQLAPGLHVYVGDLDSAGTLSRGFGHILEQHIIYARQGTVQEEEIIDPEVPETQEDLRGKQQILRNSSKNAA